MIGFYAREIHILLLHNLGGKLRILCIYLTTDMIFQSQKFVDKMNSNTYIDCSAVSLNIKFIIAEPVEFILSIHDVVKLYTSWSCCLIFTATQWTLSNAFYISCKLALIAIQISTFEAKSVGCLHSSVDIFPLLWLDFYIAATRCQESIGGELWPGLLCSRKTYS